MILTREKKEEWNLMNKIGFRFLFIYFSFYCFCLIGSGLFKPLVHWVAESVLTISYDFSSKGYGSGDTTYQYVLLLIILTTAIFGTILWSVFDKRKSYTQLAYAFSLLLRLTLVFFLFIYGFIKVFHLQMIPPTYSRLLENIGEMSPMGLAWTFMGYSKAYSIFAGASEVIAGVLLVSRRLQSLGAIMVIAVMGNVFMMNMAFDIPVKIFSFHLLMMGVVLFLYNSRRFVTAVVLQKRVEKEDAYPDLSKQSRKVIRIVKAIVTVLVMGLFALSGVSRAKSYHKMTHPILKGAWEVHYFEKNGIEHPPLLTDTERWQYLLIEFKDRATILHMDRKMNAYNFAIDTISKSLHFNERDSQVKQKFNYTRTEHTLEIIGLFKNDSLRVKFIRKDDSDFLLTSRGFNWINEKPNNK